MNDGSTFFAPVIYLNEVAPAIEFYKRAFDAIELRRWSNDDGSVHVAEMSIYGAPVSYALRSNKDQMN